MMLQYKFILCFVAFIAISFIFACGGNYSSSSALPWGTMESEEGFSYIYAEEGNSDEVIYEGNPADPRADASQGSEDTGTSDAASTDGAQGDGEEQESDAGSTDTDANADSDAAQ